MDDTTTPWRPLSSYSLRALLVVVACVAAYLGGHGAGFRAGYTKATAEYGADGFYGAYDVSDLVIPLPVFTK